MKLDPKIISALAARKSDTLFACIAICAVLEATNDELHAWVKQSVGLFAGVGGAAVVVSVIVSLLRDSKTEEKIERLEVKADNALWRAPEGMMLVTAKTEAGEPLK